MDLKKIVNSFDVLDNSGEIEKFHHLLESKFEKYEKTINVNVGSFKYPNYVTKKVPVTADNSIYLIEEDEDFRLIYNKGIAMFELTIRKGLLVSESIKLSSSLTRNKENLEKVIEHLIHKLNEPNRNNSSSF